MAQHGLLIGREGARIGLAMVCTAMCGLLTDVSGQPEEELRLILLEDSGTESMTAVLKNAAEQANRLHSFFPSASDAFYTSVSLQVIHVDMLLRDKTAAALLTGEAGRAAAFRCWLSAQQENGAFASLLAEEGPEVLTIAGAAFGGFGTAAMTALPALIRDCLPWVELNAIMLAPVERGTMQENDRHLAQTVSLLRSSPENICRTACLIGLPESAMSEPAPDSAHFIDLLAALQWMRIAEGSAREGMVYLAGGSDSFSWEDLGAEGVRLRTLIGRMLKTGILYETDLEALLKEKIASSWHLKDLRMGAALNIFRSLSDDQRYQASRELSQVMQGFRFFRQWLTQVLASMPAQFRDAAGRRQGLRRSAENYRQLIDVAGRLAMMDEEIERTGMAEESVVQRDANAMESAADELIRRADEARDELEFLIKKQHDLDLTTGGLGRFELMQVMLRGIDRGTSAGEAQAEQLRAAIAKLPAGQEAYALKDKLHRLEVHLRILSLEKKYVLEDIDECEKTGLRMIPPAVSGSVSRNTDLLDPELMQLADELGAAQGIDPRQRERLTQQITRGITGLVLPAGKDTIDLRQLLTRIGQTLPGLEGGSPVGRFTACAIACALDEAALPEAKEPTFVYLPDIKPLTDRSALTDAHALADAILLRPGAVWEDGVPSVSVRLAGRLASGELPPEWRGIIAAALLCEGEHGMRLATRPLSSPDAEAAFTQDVRVLMISRNGREEVLGVLDDNILTPVASPEALKDFLPDSIAWFSRKQNAFIAPYDTLNDAQRCLLLERLRLFTQDKRFPKPALEGWIKELDVPHSAPARSEWEECLTAILALDKEIFQLDSVSLPGPAAAGCTLLQSHLIPDIEKHPEPVCAWLMNGVPFALENPSNGWGLELVPGCSEVLQRIREAAALLTDGSSLWPQRAAEALENWLHEHTDLCGEAEEAARALIERWQQAAFIAKTPSIECPWDRENGAVRMLLNETLGAHAALLEASPFSALMTVMPGCREDVFTDRIIASSCSITFDMDAAWCAVLPPLSPELLCAAAEMGIPVLPSSMRFTHVTVAGEDAIRAELPLMGDRPLVLYRDYLPDDLLIIDPDEIPTAAIWPCIRFADDSWHDYHVYLGARGGFTCEVLNGSAPTPLENISETMALTACRDYPEWLIFRCEGKSAGVLPNHLPPYELPEGSEAQITIDCTAGGTRVLITQDGETRVPDTSALLRILWDGRQAAMQDEWLPLRQPEVFPPNVRLYRTGDRALMDGCIAQELADPAHTLCGVLWNAEEGHTDALSIHLEQVMLTAALSAKMSGAQEISWRFTLAEGMAEDGLHAFCELTSRLAARVAGASGLRHPVSGALCHVRTGLAVCAHLYSEEPDGFLAVNMDADAVSAHLMFREQARPSVECVLPVGPASMLLDTLLTRPEMLRDDLRAFLPDGDEKLQRLTEACLTAHRSLHTMETTRGLLRSCLKDHRRTMASLPFLTGTGTGFLILLHTAFLMTMCGYMQEMAYEDTVLQTYLPERLPIYLTGEDAELLLMMPQNIRLLLTRFPRLTMDPHLPVREQPILWTQPGREAVSGLAAMRDPMKANAVTGRRLFSGRTVLTGADVLQSFLMMFRACFPDPAEQLFPGMFDEAGHITPWAVRIIANVTGAQTNNTGSLSPERLADCLTAVRTAYR